MEHKLLPEELPRDPVHKGFVDSLIRGDVHSYELLPYFQGPDGAFRMDMFYLTVHLAQFRKQGSLIIQDPLAAQKAMSRVSLDGFGPDDFKLPRSTLYFDLKDCPYRIWGGPTGWHQVNGVFISQIKGVRADFDPEKGSFVYPENPEENFQGAFNFFLWGAENKNSEFPGDDANFWLLLELQGAQSFEERIDSLLKQTSSLSAELDVPSEAIREELTDNIKKTLRLVLNTLQFGNIYGKALSFTEETEQDLVKYREMHASLKRLKSAKKRKRILKQLSKLPQNRFIRIHDLPQFGHYLSGEVVSEGFWEPNRVKLRGNLEHYRARGDHLLKDLQAKAKQLREAAPAEVPKLTFEVMEAEEELRDITRKMEQLQEEGNAIPQLVLPKLNNVDHPIVLEGLEWPSEGTPE